MLQAIKKEMLYKRAYLKNNPIDTLYIGGGTPSVCEVEELQDLINKAREIFLIDHLQETTIEANPEDLSTDYIKQLKKSDINRISIGIQSFNDQTLAMLNRRHNAQRARTAIKELQDNGMENISIDLMYAIPGESLEQWEQEIEQAMALSPQHISAYQLTIEPKTILHNKIQRGVYPTPIPKEEEYIRQYEMLETITKKHGYAHYEVSNFAKEGYQGKHNSAYWKTIPYIGLGPSAHSFDGTSRQWNISSNKLYLEKVDNNTYYEKEILSLYNRYNEYVMLSLRTALGIDPVYIGNNFGEECLRYMTQKASKLLKSGSLKIIEGRMTLESKNFMISDYAAVELFL